MQDIRKNAVHPTLHIPELEWLTSVAARRGNCCEVTGRTGIVLNTHHLDGYATHPESRWDEANLIVLDATVHYNFHRDFMGSTVVPCTRKDFEAFLQFKRETGGLLEMCRGYESPTATACRVEHINLYRNLTGRESLPEGRTLWTPCPWLWERPESRLRQYVDSGLISVSQFVGVCTDEAAQHNHELYPTAKFVAVPWEDAIAKDFNPALVVLELGTAECSRSAEDFTYTLRKCPSDCVLVATVALNDPFDDIEQDPQVFLQAITDHCTAVELDAWGWSNLRAFTWAWGGTKKLTIALTRGAK
jgi:hypothetical protein